MTQIKKILLDRGATSPTKTVTRAELEQITGMTDRKVRHQIEKERSDGALICFWQDRPGGYYLATNYDDCKRHIKIQRARINAIEKALAPFERATQK